MNNQKNERSEKIKLLTGLENGFIKLTDLLPPKVLIYDESTGLYLHGKIEISEKEFQEMETSNMVIIELSNIVRIRPGSPNFKECEFFKRPPFDSDQVRTIITHLRKNKHGTQREN